MDTHALKSFLTLPKMSLEGDVDDDGTGSEGGGSSLSYEAYTKFVLENIQSYEIMLVLVGMQVTSDQVENFKLLCPEGTAMDIHRILDLRGVSRSDQLGLVERGGFATKSKSLGGAVTKGASERSSTPPASSSTRSKFDFLKGIGKISPKASRRSERRAAVDSVRLAKNLVTGSFIYFVRTYLIVHSLLHTF